MATSTISNTITDPAGTAIAGVRVVARLVPPPCFRTADGSEIDPVVETVTNGSGVWSLTLEETAGISPSGSHYEIVEYLPSKPRTHTIQVGASNQSLFASLVTPPPAADGNSYLTQVSADARYQQLGALGGAAADVAAAASNGVSSAAARSDHVHKLPSGLLVPGMFATGYRPVFSGTTAPSGYGDGDIFLDTDDDISYAHDGTASRPLGWSARSWTAIDQRILNADGATSFTSIPQTFNDLKIEGVVRSSVGAGLAFVALQFNGDTGANYDHGGGPSSDGVAGTTASLAGAAAATKIDCGLAPGTGNTANRFATLDIFIPAYTSTVLQKILHWKSVWIDGATSRRMDQGGGCWRNAGAVNRIDIGPNNSATAAWLAGSRITLLGRR